MKDELKKIQEECKRQLKEVADFSGLSALEQKFFSRKSGELTQIMKGLKQLSDEMRKEVGKSVNQVKQDLEELFLTKKAELEDQALSSQGEREAIDVTQPRLPKKAKGHLHPMTIIQQELSELFQSMGFMVLDGPELESDYYNFETLNISKDHPARENMDTFYIKGHKDWVMRTHTSPMQVRTLQKYGAPLRAVVPGRCFRNEATDGSHEHTFYQLEGLVVDKNISIADLIGVMKGLLEGVLKRSVEVRLRPGFFPFVEPGFELDMNCLICSGKGCKACKHSGWIEMIPCGLVHPKVLEFGGLDPKEYSGFAFGLGSMRLCMQRFGIEDIRYFMGGDLRFLQQF